MLIAFSVQGELGEADLMVWKRTLHDDARPGTAFLYSAARGGFYYISADSPATTQRLLLRAAHQIGA
jgi:hypothetical protein